MKGFKPLNALTEQRIPLLGVVNTLITRIVVKLLNLIRKKERIYSPI